MIMIPTNVTSLIDDGLRCWMTPLEAATYTGATPAEVVYALLGKELAGLRTPGGGLTDCLLARDDLDRWLADRVTVDASA